MVNVVGFKRGYGYLDEILSLAKPFGKVVRHLVLHSRPEVILLLLPSTVIIRFFSLFVHTFYLLCFLTAGVCV